MKRFVMTAVMMTALILGMSSCKPKQSAYKAAWERAKEREIAQQDATQNSQDEIVPIAKSGDSSAVVSERVTPAAGEDASGLKAYSVVIGSFTNITNAKSLKERMIKEGYRAILAQNEQGMFRVIVASFDNKIDAVNSREAIKNRFAPLYSDAWILQRSY